MDERSRLLLVDDDELTLQMLEASLEPRYRVGVASRGLAALDLLAQQPFELMLLDVDMPGLDGYQTCQRLREGAARPDLPVIFLSACASIEERLHGYAVGADDYLTKPFDPDELQAKIERVLQQRRGQLAAAPSASQWREQPALLQGLTTPRSQSGEGAVLALQTRLLACDSPAQVADALLQALVALGLEACLRARGHEGALSCNPRGPCTALEASILDHLEAQRVTQPRRALGPHAAFRHEALLLFVRHLRLDLPEDADPAWRQRIDHVATMVDAAGTRLQLLDTLSVQRDLATAESLMRSTRHALADIAVFHQSQRLEVQALCEDLRARLSDELLTRGAAPSVTRHFEGMIRQHTEAIRAAMDRGQEAERCMTRVISRLGAAAPPTKRSP